jgi:hypothetical protein
MPVRRLMDPDTGEMIDVDLDDEQPPEPDNKDQRTNAEWAALRKQTSEAKRLEKENAFLRAGIAPDDPRMGYFVRGYDGEMNADAIKEAARTAGFLPDEVDAAVSDLNKTALDAAAVAANTRISAAAVGANTDPTDGQGQLRAAFLEGGQPAMLAKARELGIPVQYEGQGG